MNKLKVPQKYIGIPFKENGNTFEGADCINLAKLFVEEELNVKVTNIPLDTAEAHKRQEKYLSLLENIPMENLIPGDVTFFAFAEKWHCGIYVGYGKMLHIAGPAFKHQKPRSAIIDIQSRWKQNYLGAIRTEGKTEILVPDAGTLETLYYAVVIIVALFSVYTAITAPKPSFGNDTGSPKYGFEAISNTISNEIIFPIPFGQNKYGGNIIWYESDGDTIERIIILGIGQIQSISDVRVNDIPIADLPGCSYSAYLGTPSQTVDARASGTVHGLRNIAYIAVTLESSDKLPGGDPTVTCVYEGLLMKTWNGSIWTGSTYSRNPAACARKLLIMPREDGGAGVDEADLNDTQFGEVYDYCAAQVDDGEGGTHERHQFDFVFDAEKPIQDALKEIFQPAGIFIVPGEKIGIKILKEESSAFTFDMDNITAGSFKYYMASKNESFNQVKVRYSDPDQNDVGVEVTAIDQLDQVKYGTVRSGEFSFLGINRFAEAARRAEFIKNESNVNVIYCELDTDTNALQNTVGDVGTVTHDLPGWTAKLFRIMKITEEGDFTRHVVLKEETPSIHNDSMSSVIESYDYGSPSNPYAPVTDVTNLQISEATYYLDKDGKVGSDINVSWTAPTDDTKRFIKYYQIELKKGAGDYEVVAVIGKSATSYTIVGVEAEVAYYVRVKIISSNDVVSDGSASAELTVNGKVALPSNVANFAYTFTNEIVLTWDKLADKDLWGYEIRTEDANWGVQSAALIFRGLANKFTIVTPASRAPGTYYIKAYDRSGNFSDAAQSVTPTNTIPSIPTIAATQWFGFAKIEWTDSADTDLQYYEIYKSHTNAWGGEEFLEVRVPGTAGILQGNDPVDATADAVDSTSITDAEIAGKGADYFVGDIILQTSGTHKDQETTVTAYNTTTGQVTVASWPSGTPDVGDTFALKDRAYYKVRAVDTYGPGTFSSAATINFTPLTEAELGDEIISARKLTTGELISLTAQIKDAIITTAKILSLNADKINVGTLTGFTIQTASSGSRIVLTPNSLICYDDAANEVFKVLTSGADVGDVIIGDFAGNKGIKWDKSAATFSIRGALNADDIAAGTMSAARIGAGTFVGGSFVVGTGGDIKSADYVAGTTGFKLHPSTGLEINTGAMKGSVMEQFGITKTEAANGSISVIGDIVSVTLVATGKKIHAWSSGSVTGTFYVNSVAVITIKLYIDGTLVRSVSTTMNVIANGTYCVPFALSGTKDVSSGNRIIKVNYSKTGTMGASPTVDFDVIAMETRDQ